MRYLQMILRLAAVLVAVLVLFDVRALAQVIPGVNLHRMVDGLVTFLSRAYIMDPDLGTYRIGADNEGFVAGGTLRWDYNTTRLRLSSGYGLEVNGVVTGVTSVFTSTSSTPSVQGINNSNGSAVEGVINSGTGIAVNGISASTSTPAVRGLSTGYYAGDFANVSDLGSSGANASAIGVHGHSRQSNAGYMEQGEVGVDLTRTNVYPAFYVTKVGNLAGFDMTGAVIEGEDTTASTGPLFRLLAASSVVKFLVAKSGETEITTASGSALTVTQSSTGDTNFRIRRTGGTTSDWFAYLPSGSTDLRFYSGSDRLVLSGGNATQAIVKQATPPTCSSNCGTSPSVSGSDTAMIVTMGSSGSPASGWVVTFNGTWSSAPSCIAQSALAGMAVGKMPIVVETTTTTITVTTNGTAPSTSDKYAIHCFGVS